MNKLLLIALFSGVLFANEANIPVEKTQMHTFKKSVALNAKVIQLSNAQQSITSLVSGHLEKYFVKPAQSVQKGDKIARIESIKLSQMSADYIALKKQLVAVSKNYNSIKNLYEKGMISLQKLNEEAIKRSEISAKLTALRSQLTTLGINTQSLQKATPNFYLRSHSSGRVAALLKPLHSVVNPSEGIATIVKNQAYYVKSYLPIEYATRVHLGDKILINYANKEIVTHVTQIMPKLDEQMQRIVVLSSVDEKVNNLFINAYVQATLYFGNAQEYVSVKKSALSFFNNEWVVFVPNEESGEEALEYLPRAIEIVAKDDGYIGVKGLKLGEEYVSGESYYIKSALLKSSLGDGD